MLDDVLKNQLRSLLKDLESHYTLYARVSSKHPKCSELLETLEDLASCSKQITVQSQEDDGLSFSIYKNGVDTRIKFRSTPNGHEFSSLILAILNCDGKGKTLPDEQIIRRLKQLNGPIHLVTYVNLTCLICSEIVQTLNAMTIYNDQMHHEIVDGGINKMEVIEKRVMSLPSVFANCELFLVGRASYATIMEKLDAKYGT